jgi:predicted RNase H-like HicB family nuclease
VLEDVARDLAASPRPAYDDAVTRAVQLTAVYEPVEDGWVQARIEEMPEVITAAPTHAEAKAALLDALGEYLQSLRNEPESTTDADAQREPVLIELSA